MFTGKDFWLELSNVHETLLKKISNIGPQVFEEKIGHGFQNLYAQKLAMQFFSHLIPRKSDMSKTASEICPCSHIIESSLNC